MGTNQSWKCFIQRVSWPRLWWDGVPSAQNEWWNAKTCKWRCSCQGTIGRFPSSPSRFPLYANEYHRWTKPNILISWRFWWSIEAQQRCLCNEHWRILCPKFTACNSIYFKLLFFYRKGKLVCSLLPRSVFKDGIYLSQGWYKWYCQTHSVRWHYNPHLRQEPLHWSKLSRQRLLWIPPSLGNI